MPRGQVSSEDRLRIKVTRLENLNRGYRQTIAELKTAIKAQNLRIKELEAKLEDKEAQRKQLLSYLYKPNKENKEQKQMGKKPGASAHHRPLPKDNDVTNVRLSSPRFLRHKV
jgi:chromosome segregation ATPase